MDPIALPANRRIGRGTFDAAPHSASIRRYRRYPPNSSSPPSPDSATVTCLRVMPHTRAVGICDGSANGSSYSVGSRGMTSSASLARTYSSVCSVPRCSATARAR